MVEVVIPERVEAVAALRDRTDDPRLLTFILGNYTPTRDGVAPYSKELER